MKYNLDMINELVSSLKEADIFTLMVEKKDEGQFVIAENITGEVMKVGEENSNVVKLNKNVANLVLGIRWNGVDVGNFNLEEGDFVDSQKDMVNEFVRSRIIETINTYYFTNWYRANIFPLLSEDIGRSLEFINGRLGQFGIYVNYVADGKLIILTAYREGGVLWTATISDENAGSIDGTMYIRIMANSVFKTVFFENNGMGSWYEPA